MHSYSVHLDRSQRATTVFRDVDPIARRYRQKVSQFDEIFFFPFFFFSRRDRTVRHGLKLMDPPRGRYFHLAAGNQMRLPELCCACEHIGETRLFPGHISARKFSAPEAVRCGKNGISDYSSSGVPLVIH